MSFTHGAVWWSELMTRDVDKAVAYYTEVCGWSVDRMEMPTGPYWVAVAHGKPVAGIMDMTGAPGMDQLPPHWFTYIAVDDVDAALAETEARGGTVVRPSFDVPGVGRIGIVTDPAGAALGLMTPTLPGAETDAEDDPPLDNLPV